MKNSVLVILFAVAVLAAGSYIRELHKRHQAEATIAGLRQDLAEAESRLDKQEHRTATLQTRLKDTRAKAVAKSEEVSHLEQALTNRAQAAVKTENPIAEMLKNPDMKEFVKAQQKTALSGIIDKNYATF